MNLSLENRINRYKKLLVLDQRQVEAARIAWLAIEPHMTKLVDKFYEHLFAVGYGPVFEQHNLTAIKRGQRAYWRMLFLGEVESAYKEHIEVIRKKHHDAGVELADYIAAYAWFSEHFFQVIGRFEPPKPHNRHDLLVATNKIIYLDMMIATCEVE